MMDAVRWRRWILDSLPLVVSPGVTLDSGQGFLLWSKSGHGQAIGGGLEG